MGDLTKINEHGIPNEKSFIRDIAEPLYGQYYEYPEVKEPSTRYSTQSKAEIKSMLEGFIKEHIWILL